MMRPVTKDIVKYLYDKADDSEANGWTVCDVPGYNFTHICYLIAKERYYDDLADNGQDFMELVRDNETGEEMIVQDIGDRVYDGVDNADELLSDVARRKALKKPSGYAYEILSEWDLVSETVNDKIEEIYTLVDAFEPGEDEETDIVRNALKPQRR